ncbi:glutamate uptake regulatory protein [Roseibium sp. TrichSKD4]|uniref:Lrp/AsnC family transcriptional regulator n=1 Tax=Roseibium sp. TrichSKD4 TaxID=744980 RepID=UPI0001E5763A|nr:Lrp/AsnC family transcriptional regulator [Roseibium sp. TrichSKD4]EFO29447.1 glutamate uptake regulatory protein [Roseibium sp. TrichSKD4]
MMKELDQIDRRLLNALQEDSRLSQRDLADKIGLSQNACWRRLKALDERRLIKNHTVRLDSAEVGLPLTVFMMVRTRHHSKEWLEQFRKEILAIANIIDFYRIAGDYDYMLKVAVKDMNAFDRVYQRIIEKVDLDTVTSYMTMEAIADARPLPV